MRGVLIVAAALTVAGCSTSEPETQATGLPAPGALDRMGAFSRGYSEGGLIGAIAATGDPDKTALARNQTYQWLIKQGEDEETARAAVANPDLLKAMILKHGAKQNSTSVLYTATGSIGHAIDCSGLAQTWNACFAKAGALCGAKGYSIISQTGELEAVSGARSIVVTCKA